MTTIKHKQTLMKSCLVLLYLIMKRGIIRLRGYEKLLSMMLLT